MNFNEFYFFSVREKHSKTNLEPLSLTLAATALYNAMHEVSYSLYHENILKLF